MKRRSIVILTLTLIIATLLCSCKTQSQEEIKAREIVQNAIAISLSYDATFQEHGQVKVAGVSCSIRKGTSYSTFRFVGTDKKPLECEISNATFDEIKDLILSKEIKPYNIPADSSGKLVYETVPVLIAVRKDSTNNPPLYLTEVPNINDIISKLQAIYDSMEK